MPGVADFVTGIIGGVGDAAVKIRTAITGVDPATAGKLQELAAQLEAQKAQAEADMAKAQAAVNQTEAASTNWFVAGWRPAVGWVCALAFGFEFLILPIAQWVVQISGITTVIDGKAVPLTLFHLDLTTMMPVLLGMLGLGAYRTWEKTQGVQNQH
jgi:roadblock/LC7 domain-containing protein